MHTTPLTLFKDFKHVGHTYLDLRKEIEKKKYIPILSTVSFSSLALVKVSKVSSFIVIGCPKGDFITLDGRFASFFICSGVCDVWNEKIVENQAIYQPEALHFFLPPRFFLELRLVDENEKKVSAATSSAALSFPASSSDVRFPDCCAAKRITFFSYSSVSFNFCSCWWISSNLFLEGKKSPPKASFPPCISSCPVWTVFSDQGDR